MRRDYGEEWSQCPEMQWDALFFKQFALIAGNCVQVRRCVALLREQWKICAVERDVA